MYAYPIFRGASSVAQHQPLGWGHVHNAVHFAQDNNQEGRSFHPQVV